MFTSEVEVRSATAEADRKALEALVVDNPDLEHLEELLDQFNIFEAIGAVRQELRHSDFLAFLLNPQQSHGLGDVVVKRLLQRVLVSVQDVALPVTTIDFDVWSLDGMIVYREWQSIDVLLLDESHKLAVIIENKIDTSEHSDQLNRYYRSVQHRYPDWSIVGLYLTPAGNAPSDNRYVAVSYGLVCELVDHLAKSRASTLGTDVQTLMLHYAQMLRRHIVSESSIADLCRRIYQKHKAALDLIYEHRPDQQAAIQELLGKLVKSTLGLILDRYAKSAVNFSIEDWEVSVLKATSGQWTSSARGLMFEFTSDPNRLRLRLIIGPADPAVRQRILDTALAQPATFKAEKTLYSKFNTIYSRTFLTAKDYEGTHEEMDAKIRQQWTKFLKDDLPAIKAAIRVEDLSQLPQATP
jgi:PD-(D/E)XK nuclease superfamily